LVALGLLYYNRSAGEDVVAHKDFFEAHRGHIAIVSGGFDDIIWPVADALGIPRELVYANAFVFDAQGIARGVDTSRPLAQAGGKVRAVAAADIAHPLVVVGDGWTDYQIKEQGAADAFIAYTEHVQREKVVAQADAVAASFDDILRFVD
jgi:D-3-phosphoglycerate dehydrogenase